MAELPDLEFFEGRVNYLEELDKERDEMYKAIDTMLKQEWELPEEAANVQWVFKSVTPIMAQVSESGARILSDVNPRVTITPQSEEQVKVVDQHEKGLKWLLDNASRRRKATIVEDVVRSSINYAENAAHVIYLPEQIANVKEAGGNPKRFEAAMRRGPFVVTLHHPSSVHARYSDIGPEEVALVSEETPNSVIDLYGSHADELKVYMAERASKSQPLDTVILKDYYSWDAHVVWVTTGETDGPSIEIIRDEWPYPFLPWACRMGGTSLADTEDQRRPLLYDAYKGELYEVMNRVRTLRYSEVLRFTTAPRKAIATASGDIPQVDASKGDLFLPLMHDDKVFDLAPAEADPATSMLHAELRNDHERSTLSSILLGGEIPSGAAFASINIVTHTAMGVLKPYQFLAEATIADILEIMLLWIHYSGKDAVGYGLEENDLGQEYLIEAGDIDPKNLYISVGLEADVPTDRQARAATAGMLLDRAIIDRREAMENVGVTDVSAMEERIVIEALLDNKLQIHLQNEQLRNSEEMRQQIIQEFIQEMQAQQAQEGPGLEQPQAGGTEGLPVEGPEFDQNLEQGGGGAQTNQFFPELGTFEGQTGTSRRGEDIA
jgi:hypothetical protein